MKKRISVILIAVLLLFSAVFGVVWNSDLPIVSEIKAGFIASNPQSIEISEEYWAHLAVEAANEGDYCTIDYDTGRASFYFNQSRAKNVVYNTNPLEMTQSISFTVQTDFTPSTAATSGLYTQGVYVRFMPDMSRFTNMNAGYNTNPGLDFRIVSPETGKLMVQSFRHQSADLLDPLWIESIKVTGDLTQPTIVTVEYGTRNSKIGWLIYLNGNLAGFIDKGHQSNNSGGEVAPGTDIYHSTGGYLCLLALKGGTNPTNMYISSLNATPFDTGDHTYNLPAATCTTAKTCVSCGFEAEAINPNGHNPGAAATCIASQTCTLCSQVIAPATGIHTNVYEYAIPYASCESTGIRYTKCTVCGAQGANEVVSQKTHSEATVQILEVNDGNIQDLPAFINAINFDNTYCCGRININLTSPATVIMPRMGIIKPMTINGPGVDKLTLQLEEAGYFFGASRSLTVNNVRWQGNPSITPTVWGDRNGGISISGANASFTNCIFENFKAYDYGGALQLHVNNAYFENCSFLNNETYSLGGNNSHGGALYLVIQNGGTGTIKNCLFNNNTAPIGSAAHLNAENGNEINIINTTITNNRATYTGASYGVMSPGTDKEKYYNCTILNNTAAVGTAPGLAGAGLGTRIFGSIIAGNTVGGTPYNFVGGADQAPSAANGYNIIGYTGDYTADKIFGTSNPVLKSLSGQTPVIMIVNNSPAQNAIPAGAYSIPATDARGQARPSLATGATGSQLYSDIGAVEFDQTVSWILNGGYNGLVYGHDTYRVSYYSSYKFQLTLDRHVNPDTNKQPFERAISDANILKTYFGSITDDFFNFYGFGTGYRDNDENIDLPTQTRAEALAVIDYYISSNQTEIDYRNNGFGVNITDGTGGTTTGASRIGYNGTQTYTIAAEQCYKVKDVKVNGYSLGAVSTFTLNDYPYWYEKWVNVNSVWIFEHETDKPWNILCRNADGSDYEIVVEYERDHDAGAYYVTTDPTCTVEGVETLKCTKCFEIIGGTRPVDPTGHDAGTWVQVLAPTDMAEGSEELRCTIDGAALGTRSIPMIIHPELEDYNAFDKVYQLFVEHPIAPYSQFDTCTRTVLEAAKAYVQNMVTFAESVSNAYFVAHDMGDGFFIIDTDKTTNNPSDERNAIIKTEEKKALPTQTQAESIVLLNKFVTLMQNMLDQQFTVTKNITGNGTISGPDTLGYRNNAETVYTITPDANHHIVSAYVKYVAGIDSNAGGTKPANTYFEYVNTWIDVSSGTYTVPENMSCKDFTIEVVFAPDDFMITVDAGAGVCDIATGNQPYNSTVPYKFTAPTGYQLDTVTVGGATVFTATDETEYTYNLQVSSAVTIAATYKPLYYTVTVSAGANGSSDNSGGSKAYDSSENYTFTADTDYAIDTLTVGGVAVDEAANQASYTLNHKVSGNVTISVSFKHINHSFTVLVSTTNPANCTTPGTGRYKCSVCDLQNTVDTPIPIDLNNHDPYDVDAVPAECTKTGTSAGKKCTRCDWEEGFETIAPLDHNMVDDLAIEATCETTGLTAGVHCTRCSTQTVAQTATPVLGHNMIDDLSVEATCETTGLTAGVHCTRCSTQTVAQTVTPVLGHNMIDDLSVEATCETTGLTAGVHCTRCSTQTVAQTVTPALGHNLITEAAIPATCTLDGVGAGKYCDRCNNYTEGYEVITKTGHNYINNWFESIAPTCSAYGQEKRFCQNGCGTFEVRELAKLHHIWGGWATTLAPSCTAIGIEIHYCNNCTAYETRNMGMTHHEYGNWFITENANCTHAGTERHNCANCVAFETQVIPVNGIHDWSDWSQINAPTCSLSGSESRHCQHNSSHTEIRSLAINPDAHNYSDWVVVRAATHDTAGLERRTCSGCGSRIDRTIPVLTTARIQLNVTKTTMEISQTLTIIPTVTFTEPGYSIIWTSSNPAIATVDANGVVTAVKSGSAIIYAKVAGTDATAFCEITVKSESSSKNMWSWLIEMIRNIIEVFKKFFGVAA